MTRKVAEKIIRGITDKIECNTADIDDWAEFWGFTREDYEEFLDLTIKALEQESVLDKIFCIVHPLSIMSTPELEHKAIMQIAEMLEPLCLPESEEQE